MVRVLLDGGSDSSFIRSSVAEELGLITTQSSMFACIGFQEKVEEPRLYNKVQASLQSRFGDDPVSLELWSTDRLCCQLQVPSAPPASSVTLERMADDFSSGQVDVLIGIDHLYDIILWEQQAIGDGLRAIDTVFGFVIHGHEGSLHGQQQLQRHSYHVCRVEKTWDIETEGITSGESEVKSAQSAEKTDLCQAKI